MDSEIVLEKLRVGTAHRSSSRGGAETRRKENSLMDFSASLRLRVSHENSIERGWWAVSTLRKSFASRIVGWAPPTDLPHAETRRHGEKIII
jgi:hypothetical protein